MGKESLYAALIAHTPLPESVVAMGARLCYSDASIAALAEKSTSRDQSVYLQKLIDMGHLSPVEHVSYTFGIEGVSRALLAQITRHRIASFSVQSQRYVTQTDDTGFGYIVPPSIQALGPEATARYDAQMRQIAAWYDEWNASLGLECKEDARFVLPNACETRMVVTMNARELLHFCKVRCCERAQWEIRCLAWAMLAQLLRVSPQLFALAGPNCRIDACGEGNMCCGRATEIAARWESLEMLLETHADSEQFARIASDWAIAQFA